MERKEKTKNPNQPKARAEYWPISSTNDLKASCANQVQGD